MTTFRWAIAFWLAAGLTAFTVWTTWTFTRTTLPPRADWTSWLVFNAGRAFVWLFALLAAGTVFGLAARAAWTLAAG